MPDGYSSAMPPSAATPPFRSDRRQRKLVASAPSRIVILVENLPVPSDRRVWQQATTLARAGHSVTVICPKGKGWTRSREMIEGVTILRHRLPEARGRLGYPLEYAIALGSQTLLTWRVFLRSGIDVIQACNPPDLLFLIAAQFKPFGVRFIFDHHDLSPELFEVKFGAGGCGYRILRALERMTFRLADRVICTNESFRRIAIERGGKDANSTDVVLSSPEIRPEMNMQADPALRRGRRHAVLYVGVMGSQDGVDLLLDAAFELVHTCGRNDVQFLLAGDGPERPALVRRAAELGLTEHVTFLGFVTGPRLWQAFRSSDLGVCPDPKNSFNDHLTMNKLLEYMAFGLPVVAFDLTVSMQLVGDAGRFVSDNNPSALAQEIARLLDDPEARRELGARGQHRSQGCLSWQRQAETLVTAYDRIGALRRHRREPVITVPTTAIR
jgi:glycosyltransferase involved in cell wall biosynthesis